MSDRTESFDSPLPTFSVLARFRSTHETSEDAERDVAARLTAAEEPFHEVTVERHDDDGAWMITARFVLVSVDAGTAVAGLYETLNAAGLAPDEVWLDRALA